MFKERHVERIRKTYKKKKKKNTYILCLVSIIIFMLGLKFRSRLKLVLSFKVQETYIIYIISIAPPRGAGLKSHPIPVPPPLRGGENPHGAKRGGAGQAGRGKIAIPNLNLPKPLHIKPYSSTL